MSKKNVSANAFVAAFEARIEDAKKKNASATNLKKLTNMRNSVSNERLASLLADSAVDAERFSRAIYASEKTIKFAKQAVELNARELNENTYAIFRTAINCYRNNVVMTVADTKCAISKHNVVADDRKHLVFVRNTIQTDETVNAQHQTSIDALVTLNILTASAAHKNAYDVHMTALAAKLCEQFNIDTTLVEVEESKIDA